MSFVSSRVRLVAAAALAALACSAANAAVVTYIGTQGPKANLFTADVPDLTGSAASESAKYQALVQSFGGNEFEGSNAPLGFHYGPNNEGTASFSSAGNVPTIKDGNVADLSKGRYNMTRGLGKTDLGLPDYGHWIETKTGFSVDLSLGVTALSFFGIDMGDYKGKIFIDLFVNDGSVVTKQLQNTEADMNGDTNGNLLFFGATSSDPLVKFMSIQFRVEQPAPDPITGQVPQTDVFAFDSFSVGNYNGNTGGGDLPEPASLALVGLALAAGGVARRRSLR